MSVDLKQRLAAVWTDRDVARLYRYRPSYPPAVFDILERRIVAPRTVLDAGCGTGALARRMTRFASRIDAVDPSPAMLDEARSLEGGDDPRIRWILGSAETAPLDPPYGLITTGQSLHWMDQDVVMPRFRDALAPGGLLVITDIEWEYPPRWSGELQTLIKRYSPVRHLVRFDEGGHFERHGFQRTSTVAIDQSIDDFVRALQSTSTLSTVIQADRSEAFTHDVRELFARLGEDRVRYAAAGNVVWGRPLGA